MNNITKDQLDSHDICKKSPIKPERDLYRVCPSKLSKRELENLYFSLLENNIELKKTLHAQKEKLKILSTKVQRLTVVQRNAAGKEKDGANNNIIVNEQKDIIEDLKRANEQMADRIRVLNMRLCSAKQFLRRSSSQILKCPKCSICPVVFRTTSTNNISSKNQSSVKMTSTSSQYIPLEDEDVPQSLKPTRTVETEIVPADYEKGTEKQCNENKCRTVMDELKQKIANLQEELSKTHDEYSKRISKLESDVSGLYQENIQVKAAAAASEHALQVKERDSDALKGTLRDTEGTVNDLKMQLSIERRKVKELETALRLANRPSNVATIIEKMNNQQDEVQAKSQPSGLLASGSMSSYYSTKQELCDPPRTCYENCGMLSPPNSNVKEDTNISKSDDSGYADPNKSSDAEDFKVQTQLMERANQEILKRISELQLQLDNLRIKAAAETVTPGERKLSNNSYNDEKPLAVITNAGDQPNTMKEGPVLAVNSKVDCECSKPIPEKDINTSTPLKYNEAEASTSREPEPDPVWKDLDTENIPKKDEKFANDINDQNNQLATRPAPEKTKFSAPNKDEDNRYQIPGPIPSICSYKDKKNTFQKSKSSSKDRDKKIDCKGKCPKVSRSDKDNSDSEKSKDVKSTDITTPKGSLVKTADPAKSLGQKITIVDPKSDDEEEDDNKNKFEGKKVRDSIHLHQKHLSKDCIGDSDDDKKRQGIEITYDLAEVKKESLSSFYNRSNTTVTQVPQASQQIKDDLTKDDIKRDNMKEDDMKSDYGKKTTLVEEEATVPVLQQCLTRATICNCPKLTRREVNVFRTCSGTLRFHTIGPDDKFRPCSCPVDTNGTQDEVQQPLQTSPSNTQASREPISKEISANSRRQPLDTISVSTQGELPVSAYDSRKLSTNGAITTKNQQRPIGSDDHGTLAFYVPMSVKDRENPANNNETPKIDHRNSVSFFELTSEKPTYGTRELATRTGMPVTSHQDSATYTEEPLSDRRNSATYTGAPVTGRRDSATYTGMPATCCRDSATYSGVPVVGRRDSATYTGMPATCCRDSATYSGVPVVGRRDSATYTRSETVNDEPNKCKASRSTSPANTEREISSLSDLPPEKDVKSSRWSPRRTSFSPLSPGEEKYAAATSTDTDTKTCEYGALSDGEIPQPTPTRTRKLSFGERSVYIPRQPVQSTTANMEETLNAITAELAHCRKLLAAAKDHESMSSGGSESSPWRPPERVHRLRAAPNKRRLSDATPRTAVFALHIGTLVLSDEAVLHSRDKSLCLTWQFYEQPLAMTRMRAGRVLLFDFSTEYDVTFTEDFLNYMKQEEMQLTICDINQQDVPYATCSLPLREVLMHTNRRADMSLALVAGPAMWARAGGSSGSGGTGGAGGADRLVSGDELGVLDLWCMLRVSPSLHHRVNCALARNWSSPDDANQLACGSQADSMEERISQELDITTGTTRPLTTLDAPEGKAPGEFRARLISPEIYLGKQPFQGSRIDCNRDWSLDRLPSIVPGQDAFTLMDDRPSDIPDDEKRRQSMQTQHSMANMSPRMSRRRSSGPIANELITPRMTHRRSSVPIANEVAVKIRNTDEMKEALEKNLTPTAKSAKKEEELSQNASSIGSLRNVTEKHRLRDLNAPKTSRIPEGLQDMLKEERKLSLAAAAAKIHSRKLPFSQISRDEDECAETADSRKSNDMDRYTGSSKQVDTSKKSVTYDVDQLPPNYPTSTGGVQEAYTLPTLAPESSEENVQSIDITILWLALNEECEAMVNEQVRRLYVAYSFLGRRGADLETPISLPKPKHYADKCFFNFKKTFQLHDSDLPLLGHMSRCRAGRAAADPRDCIVFTVVSEPPEDPLGLSSCQDIGNAYLYLGDILAYSAGGAGYTEVVPVRTASAPASVCGVLAVRVDGLQVLRRCLSLSHSNRDLAHGKLL